MSASGHLPSCEPFRRKRRQLRPQIDDVAIPLHPIIKQLQLLANHSDGLSGGGFLRDEKWIGHSLQVRVRGRLVKGVAGLRGAPSR